MKQPVPFRCVAVKTRADGSLAMSDRLVIAWQAELDQTSALRETILRCTNFGWRVKSFHRATVADERELWHTLPQHLREAVERWEAETAPYVSSSELI